MPVLPVNHFTWQCLRTVKRSKKPLTGRALRLVPSRRTKDGSFLTEMVEAGLMIRATGTVDDPFEATYSLTEQGEQAAEFGECEMPVKPKVIAPVAAERPKKLKKAKSMGRGSK
ncbi:hypothetical protein VT84_15710 [Gemmata sp. SH-PL17]|uniref:hypothetical protein n=1 Tax=Gemmata sp. SH-PL17 TaxID=1630693 RepID=UPI0006968F28|nr:hypothetical protein [Gemmata sp. SH-PL17]AMV25844.1 hypothetical protein VT84_15710 [Gemmata sp. SH-PL17]